MFLRKVLTLGLLLVSGLAFGATGQNANFSYVIQLSQSRFLSTTHSLSSDTGYIESDCIDGRQTLTNFFKSASGRFSSGAVIYKVQCFNAGTGTVDVTALFFNTTFTSPGDNEPWALTDGELKQGFQGRVDLPQNTELEGGGDTFAEAVETNIVVHADTVGGQDLFVQLVKDKVGIASIGGDTRSASKDMVLKVWYRPFEE